MTLTPTEIESLRIAIAEECGWKYQPYRSGDPATWIRPNGIPVGPTVKELPPYTTSLDAIQAAATKRFNSLELAYLFEGELLVIKAETKTPFQHQLSALDWCIAFARTAKIWRYKL